MRHWHRDPAPTTVDLVESAPLTPTGKGLQVAIEVIAYPGGQVQVAASRITGQPRSRTIVQAKSLMFNDMDEAKDAIDGIVDRAAQEAHQRSDD